MCAIVTDELGWNAKLREYLLEGSDDVVAGQICARFPHYKELAVLIRNKQVFVAIEVE